MRGRYRPLVASAAIVIYLVLDSYGLTSGRGGRWVFFVLVAVLLVDIVVMFGDLRRRWGRRRDRDSVE